MSIEIGITVGLVSLLFTVLAFFAGHRTAIKSEGKDDGRKEARIEALERDVKCLWVEVEKGQKADHDADKEIAVLKSSLASMNATMTAMATDIRAILMYMHPPASSPRSPNPPAPAA